MTVMAPRSSTTARVSRNARSAGGRCEPTTASTASANAMSVAIGIAQPLWTWLSLEVMARKMRAGMTMPPSAASDREHRLSRVTQSANDQFPLQFKACDEEEDREQAISGPLLE